MLPNRYSHTIYYLNYIHQDELEKNPKEREAEETAEVVEEIV